MIPTCPLPSSATFSASPSIRTGFRRATAVLAIGLGILSGPGLSAKAQEAPQTLPIRPLSAGIHTIKAMVAQTPQERQIGLMHRREMGPNEGMLFVFEQAAPQCFWMRNTLLPLSAAFVGDDGRIVNIEDMAPQSDDAHCSKKPVRFVLEMHQGWFATRGLKAGDKIHGAAFEQKAGGR